MSPRKAATVIEGTAETVSVDPADPQLPAVIKPQNQGIARITPQNLAVLNAALGSQAMDANELALFAEVANRSGLDPFAKQIYAIRRSGKLGFQTGIDGYRSIAARTGEYDGQDAPIFGPDCECEKFLKDDGTPAYHPEWTEVRVFRHGMNRGVAARAYFHEYLPDPGMDGNRPKTGRFRDDAMWLRMPRNQSSKVAEALALRKAFPYIYGGLYTDDEMDQAPLEAGPIPNGRVRRAAELPVGVEHIIQNPAGVDVVLEQSPLPTQDAPRAPQTAAAPSQPPAAASATPSLPFAGRVFLDAEKDQHVEMRSVKLPRWAEGKIEPDAGAGSVHKVEIPMKINRSKHTAIVLGPLAEAVADVEGGWQDGDEIQLDGQKVEIEWAPDKPKKKEIHFVTRVMVTDGEGGWIDVGAPTSQAQGTFADTSMHNNIVSGNVAFIEQAPAANPPAAEREAGKEDAPAGNGAPSNPPVSVTLPLLSVNVKAEDGDLDAALAAKPANVVAEALAVFDDVIRAAGHAGEEQAIGGAVRTIEWGKTQRGADVVKLSIVDADDGLDYACLMAEDVASSQGVIHATSGFNVGAGSMVGAVGKWFHSAELGDVLLLSELTFD